MTPEHLPLLVELDADAEVLRYILGRARDRCRRGGTRLVDREATQPR